MTVISFTDEELRSNEVVEPAWYTLLIQVHRTWTPTRDGQSNNCHFDTIIERNADTGDTKYAGVPIVLQFNDKPSARGFFKGFLLALGVEVQAKVNYELERAVNRRIDAFVENGEWQGRISNKVNHKYRATRPSA